MTTSILTQHDFTTTEQVLNLSDDQLDAVAGGQAITLEESGMDGLVAAGPFDAVTPNEPQNNDVF